MANKIVKTFEEFISFEIEDSTVHIHVQPSETEEMSTKPINTKDEVMVSMPPMNLSSVGSSEYDEDSEDDNSEYTEMEDEE
jgi:hypothetical protein